MQQPESPTSTLLATPHSQFQDLPSNLSLPSPPSPPPASTVGRRTKLSKPVQPIKSLHIKPPTPVSHQVTISHLQDPFMERKKKQPGVQSVRIDLGAGKPVRRFTLPKMFTRSSTKQFDPYLPPPPREPSDGSTRGCSEDSTVYPRLKSSSSPQSKLKTNTTAIAASVPDDASRVDQPTQQDAPVASATASPFNGTTETRPDGIQVALKTSPPTDVPLPTSPQEPSRADEPAHPSSSSRPQPVHQESSGSQVPESLYPQGAPQPVKTPTSRSRLLVKQRAMTDSNVGVATSRRERRRWTKFWKALLKKLGFKSSAPSATTPTTPSPRKLKSKSKAPSDPDVGSVVETLPADSEETDGDAVALNLLTKTRSTGTPSPPPATRSRSNSPYMERATPAAVAEPHNIPLPGGESSLSLVMTEFGAEQEEEIEEEENPETPLHAHSHSHTHSQSLSLSSPINASSTSFTTTSSPLSVPSFLPPDRSATTITLPTTLDPNSTCLDLSIEEEGSGDAPFASSDRDKDDDTLTQDEQEEEEEGSDEEETTPTPTPCPPAAVGPMADPSASTSTLQLATITAIPDEDNSEFAFDDEEEEGEEEDRTPPSTPRLPSASHPNQTAPQLTTSVPQSTAPSPPIATRPDLKRSASTSNVVPPAAASPAAKTRTGPSKFLFVKHSRWRGNSTLGHELGIRMFEEQYPTIETSLFFDSRAQRTWLPLPPTPRQTHDDDGDSIIDVVEDDDEDYDGAGYSDFEDEPVGGWKEYFEEDDYYYQHDEEEAEGDVSTELEDHGARGRKVNAHAQQQSEDLADVAFCAASSSGSVASLVTSTEMGHAL